MALTLQTVYHTSEAAAQFVISSLIELFLSISTINMVEYALDLNVKIVIFIFTGFSDFSCIVGEIKI